MAGYVGPDALTASDYLFFKHSVKAKMSAGLGAYTVTFTDTPSAPATTHEKIHFGSSIGSTTTYGASSGIDWRNTRKEDHAHVFLKNFSGVILPGSYSRETNLDRLATAIAGTALHELGHNLGLQHFDAYGLDSIKAPGYGGIVGQQNGSIMATGATGLTAAERGDPRSFNMLEMLKLEFADDVAPTLGTTVAETAGPNDTLATAQAIAGSVMPVTGLSALNITGSLSSGSDFDLFKFDAVLGSLLTGNVFATPFTSGAPTDTFLSLLDSTGTLLASNDDISFTSTSLNGGSGFYSTDSLSLNFEAGYTGTYYFAIGGAGAGDYQFLVSGLAPVPEPATMALAALGLGAAMRRRKPRARAS